MLPTSRRRFSQNFLHDPYSIANIIHAIHPIPGQHLVEIGPGLGAITTELLSIVGTMDAVELDRDLLEPLTLRCAKLGTLRLHNADALKFAFCALQQLPKDYPTPYPLPLTGEGETKNFSPVNGGLRGVERLDTKKLRIVGNLPYNISTPLLFHLLDQAICIEDMHFLLQKEVVARMTAAPGSKTYGRLSVMIQVRCAVQRLFDIGPGAFNPVPKVESSFVRLRPHTVSPYVVASPAKFAQLVAQAFSQRRKTLRNTLRPLLSEADIIACDLDGTLRPEQLTVADFVRLANFKEITPPPSPLPLTGEGGSRLPSC